MTRKKAFNGEELSSSKLVLIAYPSKAKAEDGFYAKAEDGFYESCLHGKNKV